MKNLQEIIKLINASHKTLYILCGLPYSGKTYLAQEILNNTSCVYVSIDTILEKLGYDWNINKLPDKQGWDEVMNISYKESQSALINSLNVIYDSTNHTKLSRERLRDLAHEMGANSQIIYIDISIDSVRNRWEDNKKSKKRFVLDEKLLEMTIGSLEIPDITENAWILKN